MGGWVRNHNVMRQKKMLCDRIGWVGFQISKKVLWSEKNVMWSEIGVWMSVAFMDVVLSNSLVKE